MVGGGVAGLSAGVALAAASARVIVYEGAAQAGGRCRSYFDPQLELMIDNGNHLVLSGNRAVEEYLETIGGEAGLSGPDTASFPFVDVETKARWKVEPNAGPLPWWVFSKSRRVPGSKPRDYFNFARLLKAEEGQRVEDVMTCRGALWTKLIAPFLVAALNTDAKAGSAVLAGEVVRETLAKGGGYCRPRIADPLLSDAFIDPALVYIDGRGGEVRLGRRVRSLAFGHGRVVGLMLPDGLVEVGPQDSVVLAVPPWAAQELLPGLSAPDEFHAIVNAHYRIAPPANAEPIVGVIGGLAEWVFAFPDRLSVTISAADRLLDNDREELAKRIWQDVAVVHNLPREPLPPWQIVKERRATFAATPEQEAKRPRAATPWENLWLAGDWTDTGLPATLEGAVRSGRKAADLVLASTAV